jgi:UDP-galactose transporter B1
MTWALLQERLTTKPYGTDALNPELFKFPVFLNTVQSTFAFLTGYLYLYISTPSGLPTPAIIPTSKLLAPLLLVSLTTSLASPFGYASLAHIDYITFILAKSCKLLPVMFLHITIFRKSFPLYKYAVVLAVTAGVAVFTLHSSSKKKHSSANDADKNRTWGLLLLGINLLLDGLTNTTQDYIFTSFRPFSGPQMMCANNLLGTVITISWLFLAPHLAATGAGAYLGMDISASSSGEFTSALSFLAKYPSAWADVLGFSACGAVGQVFIFYTLSQFSSVLLVTVTVTRKMCTMILSVLWFGHRLSGMQWVGVGLVFGGVGAEGIIARSEKKRKEAEKKKVGGAIKKTPSLEGRIEQVVEGIESGVLGRRESGAKKEL